MVMMFLMKIRLYNEDLPYRFGVHISSVSRNFHRILDVVFVYTSSLIKWPDRETARNDAIQFLEVFQAVFNYYRLFESTCIF